MKLWTHSIQEPPRGKIVWYPRWFFKLYRGPEHGERPIVGGHVEFVLRKPTGEFGASFEVGTRGSETPFDGHVKIAGTALYWGIEQGGALADKITQLWLNRTPNRLTKACLSNTCDCPQWAPGATSKRHHGRNGKRYENRYEGRSLSIRTGDARLWWTLWLPKNGSTKGFASWRSGALRLNPLDRILGERRYWHDDVETRRILIDMPEAVYPVAATLQRVTFGRPKGRKLQSWGVDVKADECKGIPDHYDSSGGWKGDRVWGFGVKLKQGDRPDWHIDAKAAIEASILQRRADSGFRKPQPVEAS